MEVIERSLTGIKDVDLKILSELDDKSLLNFCQTSKYGNQLCQNEIFWINRIDRRYPYLKEFKKEDESWRRFFIRMTYYIAKLNEEFGIPYIPTKGYNPEEFYNGWNKDSKRIYNVAMTWAALGGHLNIVQYLIDKKGANDFNWALEDAAARGHLDIVQLMIEKGASKFNNAMINAAEGGYLDIVKYLIEKAREKNQWLDFDYAMRLAAFRGHLKIVDYLEQFI